MRVVNGKVWFDYTCWSCGKTEELRAFMVGRHICEQCKEKKQCQK